MRAYKSVKLSKNGPNLCIVIPVFFHRTCGHNRGELTPLRLCVQKNKSKIVPSGSATLTALTPPRKCLVWVLVDNLLVISVKEARKLLGKDGEGLSDDQIEHLIITLSEVGSRVLIQNGSKKTAGPIQ